MWNENDRKWLYETMSSNGVDTGSYEEFANSLNNKEDRDWYYNKSLDLGLDVGSAEDFYGMMVQPQQPKGGENGYTLTEDELNLDEEEPKKSRVRQKWEALKDDGNEEEEDDSGAIINPLTPKQVDEVAQQVRVEVGITPDVKKNATPNHDYGWNAKHQKQQSKKQQKVAANQRTEAVERVRTKFGSLDDASKVKTLESLFGKPINEIEQDFFAATDRRVNGDYDLLFTWATGGNLKANELNMEHLVDKSTIAGKSGYTPAQIEAGLADKKITMEYMVNKQMAELGDGLNTLEAEAKEKAAAEQAKWNEEKPALWDVAMSTTDQRGMTDVGAIQRLLSIEGVPTKEAQAIAGELNMINYTKQNIAKARNMQELAKTEGNGAQQFVAGMTAAFLDPDTWTSEYELKRGQALQGIINKMDDEGEGSLTPTEQKFLESVVLLTAYNEMYNKDISAATAAGKSFMGSIPFMFEMAINPLRGTGKVAGKKLAKWAMKRFSSKTMKKGALVTGKAIGNVAGSAVAGYGTAGTMQLGDTVAGVQERMQGDVVVDLDEDGHLVYGGQENEKDLPTAVYEETTERMLDTASEIVGAGYVSIPFRQLRKWGRGTRSLGWIDNLANSRFGRQLDNFLEKTGWHGPIEEFMEEVHVGLLSPALLEDSKLKDFFNEKDLTTTLIAVAVPGAITSSLSTAVGTFDGSFKLGAQEKWKMQNADRMARALWGDNIEQWNKIKSSLDNGSIENTEDTLSEVDRTIKAIYADNTLTNEQKKAALEYAVYSLQYKTATGVRDAMTVERKDALDDMFHEIYGTSFTERVSPAQANKSYKAFQAATAKAEKVLGLNGLSVEEWMNGRGVAEAADGNAKVAEVLTEYLSAKMDFEGKRDRFIHDRDRAYRESDMLVDDYSNNGMIYTTRIDNQDVYITGGNVVLHEDGVINWLESSEELYVRMPDGKVLPIAPMKLIDKVVAVSAESVKLEERAKIDANFKAEFDAAEVQEDQTASGSPVKTASNSADAFTLVDNGIAHTVEVVAPNNDGMTTSIMLDGEQKIIPNDLLNTWREAAGVSQTENGEVKTENQIEVAPVVTTATTGMQTAPVAQVETVQPAPKTALEQIPKNENNIPLYEQVDSELAWDGVVEEAGGNEETAMVAVNSMVEDKKKALAAAEKAKARAGVTIAEKIAAENERVANIEKAKADLAKWEEIAGVKAKRAAAQAENVAVPVVEETQAPVVESAPVAEVETPQATNEMQGVDLDQVVDHYVLEGNDIMLRDMEAVRKSNREEYGKITPAYELFYKAKERGLYPNELEELKAIVKGTSLEGKVDGWFTPVMAEGGNAPGQSGVQEYSELDREIDEQFIRLAKKRIAEIEKSMGVTITAYTDVSTITDKTALERFANGEFARGWYNPNTGEIALFLPEISSIEELESTVLHEAVAHYGIKHFLGKEDFDKFLDGVWEMMPTGTRAYFLQYVDADMKNPSKEKMRQAADEYVAHIAEKMDLNDIEKGVWDKFVDLVFGALEKMGFKNLKRSDIERVIKASYANLRHNSKADNKNVVYENDQNGQILCSIRTYDESGREKLRDFIEKRIEDGALTAEDGADIVRQMDEIYEMCVKYMDVYEPFGTWSDAKVAVDESGKPVFSVIKKNGEYGMNLDFSLVCKKRRTLDAVFDEMISRGIIGAYELGQVDIAKINAIIRRFGFETACRLCFVDSKRFRVAQVADDFCALYNELVEMSDAKLRKVIKGEKGNTVRKKAATLLLEHPENRVLLSRDNFMSANGFDNMKVNKGEIMKLYNMKKGTGGPKASSADVQYLNDVIDSSWTPEKAFAVGGVRLQSFSDYVPRMVFDYIQLVADLSAKGLPVHAYTKEALFAKTFGMTGIKINLSLVPRVDADGVAPGLDKDGNYAWQDGETFPYEEAMALQSAPEYKNNCGTIAVGVSDEHILKMLGDENIRMVIPYHKSGLNAQVAKFNNIDRFTDYTNEQNTRTADGKSIGKKMMAGMPDFNVEVHENGDPRAAAQKYLDWCDANGFLPKFDRFRDHPNYYKLLEDFTTIVTENGVDNVVPQMAVTMTFPNEMNSFGSLDGLIRQGLEEDAVLEGKRSAEVGKVVDAIQEEFDAELEEKSEGRTMFSKTSEQIEELFDKAVAGELTGKAVSVGKLTKAGKEYLESISGLTLKDDIDFVLNPSDLLHIYNNHYGENEKDKGNNIPLNKYDIRRLVDVVAFPTAIVYGEGENGRKSFYFLMDTPGGAYNLLEIYADKKGNLSSKTYYKTKKGVSQRVMNILNSLHSTSVTDGATLSDAKIPQMFEKANIESEKSAEKRTMFSKVTPEMDAEYMSAVENGDMESVERLVKEAAKLAMPDTKVVDEDGYPMVVYHGSEEDFNVFDKTKGRANMDIQGMFFSPWDDDARGYGSNVRAFFLNITKPANESTGYKALNKFQGQNGAGIKAREYLVSAGYDGVNNEDQEFVAFDPNQIKSADAVTYDDNGNIIPLSERFNEKTEDIRFSIANKNQDVFVSNAQRAIEGIKQEKATPEQWTAMLKKNGGLKAGEEAWLGLEEWLNEKQGAVTKQEILDFVGTNKIQIEEVNYQGSEEDLNDSRGLIAKMRGEDFADEFLKAFDIEYGEFGIYDEEKAYELYNRENGTEAAAEEEILAWAEGVMNEAQDNARPINSTRLDYTTKGLDNKKEIALVVPTIESWNQSDEVHFGDAGNGRAVAWVRFGETTDSEGNRVLVIDEIQSKRHQDAREKGYKDTSNLTAERQENGIWHIFNNGEFVAPVAKWNANTEQEAVEYYAKDLIPEAPFEKNWQELAMKRMLRLAAEEGFDKVAWTTGEQQAERYNIRHVVNELEVFSPDSEGEREVNLVTDRADIYLDVNSEGMIIGQQDTFANNLVGKSLSDILGKEVAASILAGEYDDTKTNGHDITFGGEGMKGFYDKMLPSFVQKYTKRWGAKVGTVEMPSLEQNNVMHSVDVTPEMKESVMEGQTMFRRGDRNDRNFENKNITLHTTGDGRIVRYEQLELFDTDERTTTDIQRGASGGNQTADNRTRTGDIQRDGLAGGDALTLINAPLRPLEEGETSLVQRVFTKSKAFDFTAGEQIESLEDVAYIFKNLEDESIENSFAVLVKDGKPVVLHLGMGHYTSSIINASAVAVAMENVKPDKVYLVHNHPSGALKASAEDVDTLKGFRTVYGDIVEKGIIINLKSGKFGIYDTAQETSEERSTKVEGGAEIPVETFAFNKQVFDKDFNPDELFQIKSDSDVAAFISSNRLGDRNKVGLLVCNNQNRVVGNVFTPFVGITAASAKKIAKDIVYYTTVMGGNRPVLFGRFPVLSEAAKSNLGAYITLYSGGTIELLDLVDVESRESIFQEDEPTYGAKQVGNSAEMQEEETRFSMRESVDKVAEGSIDDVKTQPLTFEEQITEGLLKVSAENKENFALRASALRQLGQDLKDILKRMMSTQRWYDDLPQEQKMAVGKELWKARKGVEATQRTYDKSTVDQLVKLAKMYFKNAQLMGEVSTYAVGRVLAVINNVVGKEDIMANATKLMDILLESHSNSLEGILEKAEKVKAKKVNAAGVEVMGSLDVYAQETVDTYKAHKDWDAEELSNAVSSSLDDLGEAEEKVRAALKLKPTDDVAGVVEGYETQEDSADDAVKNYKTARAIYKGMLLAEEYRENVHQAKKTIDSLKKELIKARGTMSKAAMHEFVKSTNETIMETRIELIDALHNLIYKFTEDVQGGRARAKAFVQAQVDRAREIQHNANSDMEGISADVQGKKSTKWNNSLMRGVMSSTPTFQTMLKKFGEKAVDGKGYLYERFIPQATMASEKEFRGQLATRVLIDTKLKELYGKKADIAKFAKDLNRSGINLRYTENGVEKTFDLTKGQMLYIYMANKMSDGKMKLRKMGITEEMVANIQEELPDAMVKFADWVQDELLADLRERYNKVHERMFGAPMAAIENYFPLKIKKEARGEKGDVSQQDTDNKPSTMTGSIIKRTKNSTALDLSADALAVLLEHIDQMEHWAAYAEFNRDLNTLLNYRHFQNQVKNMSSVRYGSGDTLWKNFQKVAQIASGTYQSRPQNEWDRAVLNFSKGIATSKIAFRGYTALKQLLSAPAFWNEAGITELAHCYGNPMGSWNWALENLPGFKKRWEGQTAGNEKFLKSESDWKLWHTKAVEKATEWGMKPNAFVDAVTVAVGARAVYETKLKQFKEAGYTVEKATQKALQAANEAYNESQQSSEGVYLSPIQADSTAASAAVTTFKNSNFGFTRKTLQAAANLKRKSQNDYKESSIEFMKKKLMRDGLSEEQAEKYAKKLYKKSLYKDVADLALFGFGLNLLWELGGAAIYLFLGDDDDEKEKMIVEAGWRTATGVLAGMPGGDLLADVLKASLTGEWDYVRLPMLVAAGDIESFIETMRYDKVKAANDFVNMLVAAGVHVNPQTLTDVLVALFDGDGWDAEEIGLFAMRFLNAPQSQLDKLEVDKAMENSARDLTEVMKRYVEYKHNKATPLTGWMYSDENEQKALERYAKRFDKLLDERFDDVIAGDAATFDTFYNNATPEKKEDLADKRKAFLNKGKEKEFVKLSLDDIVNNVSNGETRNEVYSEYSTAEDIDSEIIINQKRTELKPVYDALLELPYSEKAAYRKENEKDIILYKKLKKKYSEINKLKKEMKDYPEGDNLERMNKIREKMRTALDLINNNEYE